MHLYATITLCTHKSQFKFMVIKILLFSFKLSKYIELMLFLYINLDFFDHILNLTFKKLRRQLWPEIRYQKMTSVWKLGWPKLIKNNSLNSFAIYLLKSSMNKIYY